MDEGSKKEVASAGVPLGSVLRPLFCNVVYHRVCKLRILREDARNKGELDRDNCDNSEGRKDSSRS